MFKILGFQRSLRISSLKLLEDRPLIWLYVPHWNDWRAVRAPKGTSGGDSLIQNISSPFSRWDARTFCLLFECLSGTQAACEKRGGDSRSSERWRAVALMQTDQRWQTNCDQRGEHSWSTHTSLCSLLQLVCCRRNNTHSLVALAARWLERGRSSAGALGVKAPCWQTSTLLKCPWARHSSSVHQVHRAHINSCHLWLITADAASRLDAEHSTRAVGDRIFVPGYLSKVSKLTQLGWTKRLSGDHSSADKNRLHLSWTFLAYCEKGWIDEPLHFQHFCRE